MFIAIKNLSIHTSHSEAVLKLSPLIIFNESSIQHCYGFMTHPSLPFILYDGS
eukprot:jgi/Mesvir1/27986/Mv25891-RA.1